MELIDRYIYAVTQKLPQSQREDIAEELRGLIEDMLEERIGNGKVTESDVEEVIFKLGNPKELADKYRGTKRYLIGPEIFDLYLLVLKIVLIVVIASISISFLVQIILNPFSILESFIELLVSIVTGLPMAFGWTTLGFVMAEMYGGFKEKDLLEQEWRPLDLPPIPNKKRQIKRRESIVSIIFYAMILVFLTFSSDYFGIWVFRDEVNHVVPFLNEQTYGTYLLFIILILGVGIFKECLKLISGKWTYKLVVFTTFVNAISMLAILFMINGPDFWNPEFMNELVKANVVTSDSEGFHAVQKIWDQLTYWILVLMMVGLVWDAIDGLIKARKQ